MEEGKGVAERGEAEEQGKMRGKGKEEGGVSERWEIKRQKGREDEAEEECRW